MSHTQVTDEDSGIPTGRLGDGGVVPDDDEFAVARDAQVIMAHLRTMRPFDTRFEDEIKDSPGDHIPGEAPYDPCNQVSRE